MRSRITQTKVNIICRREAESNWCHAKAESNKCFIIHLKTSETYKTIKRSLLMFQVYLFHFRAPLGLRWWPRRGLGTTAFNFFLCKFDPLVNKYRILRIIRCSLTNQEREFIPAKCIIMLPIVNMICIVKLNVSIGNLFSSFKCLIWWYLVLIFNWKANFSYPLITRKLRTYFLYVRLNKKHATDLQRCQKRHWLLD